MSSAGGQGEFFALHGDETTDTGNYWIVDGGSIVTYDQYAYLQITPYAQSPISPGGYWPAVIKLDISGNLIWSYEYTNNYTGNDYYSQESETLLISDDGAYLYFTKYEDSNHEYIVTKLDTSDGSVVWSQDFNAHFSFSKKTPVMFFDSDGNIIVSDSVSFGNNISDKGKIYFQKFDATNGTRAGYNTNNSSYCTSQGDVHLDSRFTTNTSPNNNNTFSVFSGRNTGVYSSRITAKHGTFTGNSGPNIAASHTTLSTNVPYTAVNERIGGIEWISGNDILMWSEHNTDWDTNGGNSLKNALTVLTSNGPGGNISYSPNAIRVSTSGQARGRPVQDSDGDWHVLAYNGNSGAILNKVSVSNNYAMTANASLNLTGSASIFSDQHCNLACDDYGGVWISGRTGAQDYNGFVMRLPINYSDLTTTSINIGAGNTNTLNLYQANNHNNSALNSNWRNVSGSGTWGSESGLNNINDGSNNRLMTRQNIRDPNGLYPDKQNI